MVSFKIGNDSFGITRLRVKRAMSKFDKELRGREPDYGSGYAVVGDKGTWYPPKSILSLVVGRPPADFSGGERTNRVFRDLKFVVIKISSQMVADRLLWRIKLPKAEEVADRLFSQRWGRLHDRPLPINNADYPGIYAVAYCSDDLTGQRVREADVFYAGMSNQAGLRRRLEQFIKGLEDGHHHSGAKRFFNVFAHGTPYSRLRRKKTFYVAGVTVPCVTDKERRTGEELNKMGVVANAEYCVMARIRNMLGREPQLNAK